MTDTTLPTPVDAGRPDRPGGGAPAASVDYEFAKRTGRAIVNAGPQVSGDEAAAIVADLRDAAAAAVGPVAETSALPAPAGAPAPLVVDRAGWISANVDSFKAMLDPVVDKLNATKKVADERHRRRHRWQGHRRRDGRPARFLSSKVLGQYDLAPGGTPRLLLVAPNIVAAERRLEVDPTDFRRWVAMHEETHRVQFTAVPWLRDHMVARTQALAVDLAPTPEDLSKRFEQLTKNLPEVSRSGEGIGQLFATPEQKARSPSSPPSCRCSRATPTSSWTPSVREVIPSVNEIRRKFDERRNSAVGIDRLLRKLLGLEAKMRQYRDGAVFVRAVTDQVAATASTPCGPRPRPCPGAAEILDPGRLGASGPRLSDARSREMPGPDPAVAATRLAVREHLADVPEGGCRPRRLLGRPRLRRARGRARLRGAARRRAGGAVVVDHGLQERLRRGGRGRRGAVPRDGARPRRGRPRRGAHRAARASRPTPGRPATPPSRRPPTAGRRDRAHRSHPRRPGRAGAARPVPRVGCPVAQRYAGAPRPLRPPAPRPAARHDAGRLRGLRHRALGRPPQQRRLVPAGPRPAAARDARVRPRARASPRRSPAAPTCCVRTPTTSRASPSGPAPSCPTARGDGVDLDALAALPRAIRTRVWRLLAAEAGAPLADVSAAHVESLDALLTSWHGQGPLHVPAASPSPAPAGRSSSARCAAANA